MHAEGDVVERDCAGIALGDAARFQNDLLCRAHAPASAVRRARFTACFPSGVERIRSVSSHRRRKYVTWSRKVGNLLEAVPPSQRKTGQPCGSNRRELFIRRAQHGPAQDVRLELHEGAVARGAAISVQRWKDTATGFFHRNKNVCNLISDRIHRCVCQVRCGVCAAQASYRPAHRCIPVRRAQAHHCGYEVDTIGIPHGGGKARRPVELDPPDEETRRPTAPRNRSWRCFLPARIVRFRRSTRQWCAPVQEGRLRGPA